MRMWALCIACLVVTASLGIRAHQVRVFEIGFIGNKRVTATSGVEEGQKFLHPRLRIGDFEVFRDTSTIMYDLEGPDNKLVPVPGYPDKNYILLSVLDPPLADKWVILELKRNRVVGRHVAVSQFFLNGDGRGTKVVGGFEIVEAPSTASDSGYYNPAKMYRLGKEFEFDEAWSRKVTEQTFGVYLGRDFRDTVLRVRD
jgi:hypothetical protein